MSKEYLYGPKDWRAFIEKTASEAARKQRNIVVGQVNETLTDVFEAMEKHGNATADLAERLKGVDGASVLKGTATALLAANLTTLQGYCDGITLHKSRVVKSPLPKLVKGVVK